MPRSYGIVVSDFWTKGTGKRMRGRPHVQVLALYLFSCDHANMVGLYYLPIPTACHETGLTPEQFDEAMAFLGDEETAHYDPEAELVWITQMAAHRLGADRLSPGDKRIPKVRSELERYRDHPFAASFVEMYAEAFALGGEWARAFAAARTAPRRPIRVVSSSPRSPFDAPSVSTPRLAEGPSERPPPAPEAPPKPDQDPDQDQDPERERRRLSPEGRILGRTLQEWFGDERSQILGGFPWTVPPDPHGKASAFAAGLESDPYRHLIRPTMRRLLENVKAGRQGWTNPQLRTSPAFAFASWMSNFTALCEDLEGKAPRAAPAAPARRMPPMFTGKEPA